MSSDEAEQKKKQVRKQVIRCLCQEALREARPLIIGSFAMVASSLSNQALPRLVGRMIDQKSSTCDTSSSNRSLSSSWLAMVVLGGGLASFLRTTVLGTAEHRIANRLRKQAFDSLLNTKELEWFQNETMNEPTTTAIARQNSHVGNTTSIAVQITPASAPDASTGISPGTGLSPGALSDVLREDVDKVSSTLTSTLTNGLRSSSSVMFSIYHMLSLNPALFGVAFTVVPAVGAAAMLIRKSIKSATVRQREVATQVAAFVEERLTHIAVVKMSNREVDEIERFAQMQDESLQLSRQASLLSGLFMGFVFVASSSSLLMVIHLGAKSVASGKMSSGQLISFCQYSFLLGLGTSGIVKAASEFMQGIVSADRLYKLLDLGGNDDDNNDNTESSSLKQNEASLHDPNDKTQVNVDAIDSITFRNVFFAYKSAGNSAFALKDLSFELARGNIVALVGRNGSGKSTTAFLLGGLLQPSSGQIQLSDGSDWNKLDKKTRKHLVQVIPQSTALFNTSILENVRYSNPDASLEDVQRALTQANCDGFVSRLEEGMHFCVGMGGCKLSGGERQRLALARALLSDPTVLVMDEPLSSLDSEGENAVAEAIQACRVGDNGNKGRALLIISHQAKSLTLADEVLVMKNGSIVESGGFAKLSSDPNSELCRLMPDLL